MRTSSSKSPSTKIVGRQLASRSYGDSLAAQNLGLQSCLVLLAAQHLRPTPSCLFRGIYTQASSRRVSRADGGGLKTLCIRIGYRYWQIASLHWIACRPISSTTLCVQLLQLLTFRFWKGPSFLSLWLWHSDSEWESEIYQWRHVKSSKCLERLRFYDAVVERSPKRKFQFLKKIKVCEFESLIRGQDKILSTKKSALENNFLFISFSSESIRYVGFCEGWYFASSCFATDWVVKLVLYTDAGTGKNCSI